MGQNMTLLGELLEFDCPTCIPQDLVVEPPVCLAGLLGFVSISESQTVRATCLSAAL